MELTLSPYEGWTLTKEGELKQGMTGWLFDENGLYILKDGRRLFKEQLKNEKEELRIGSEDIWDGLNEILGHFKEPPQKMDEYNTMDLFRNYGPFMLDVVYQAFQINICYTNGTWNNCTRKEVIPGRGEPPRSNSGTALAENCAFKKIGTDETDIPIVVTRIGNEGAKNKIIIAGPHGNERIARFVVLETQRYFIEKGISDINLVLYFIPAMSPTLFFADARGLPFVKIEDGKYKYSGDPFEKERKNNFNIISLLKNRLEKELTKINDILSIPKLHDFMATKINEKSDNIIHDYIQKYELNGSSVMPKYGIDTNRDYHSVLKSTQAFISFINGDTNINKDNSTIIMLHGHENAIKVKDRINNPLNSDQGTVLGPYKVISKIDVKTKEEIEIGEIEETIMRYVDYMTSVLFGYKFKLKKASTDPNDLTNAVQCSYFFGGTKNDTKVVEFKGEWTRKIYNGDEGARGIPCIDIELGEKYRDGTRGKQGGRGTSTNMRYDSEIVINRYNLLQFFKKNTDGSVDGKFANVRGKINYDLGNERGKEKPFTNSFFKFLEEYYDFRNIDITGFQNE